MPYQSKTNWKFDDVVTEQDLNRIEGGIVEALEKVDSHTSRMDNPHGVTPEQIGAETPGGAQTKVDVLQHVIEADLSKLKRTLDGYSAYRSAPDEMGQYTVVEYKREDGTLYMQSTLSNPDPNFNYGTALWQFYNDAGTSVISAIRWTITYDSNNKIVSEVMAYE
ncbi:hypothetical protein [Tumebacillus lipolyticus]|uniref:Uncharacterized protein n=1 Tax=Tumebacillus lipolyticus TaxID=1280370 RepID=A0ABW4ZZY6_9BACL